MENATVRWKIMASFPATGNFSKYWQIQIILIRICASMKKDEPFDPEEFSTERVDELFALRFRRKKGRNREDEEFQGN